MHTFSILSFSVLTLLLSLGSPEWVASLSLPNNPKFDANLLLLGDAKSVEGASSRVELTAPNSSPSSGLLIQRKPFKFVTASSKRHAPTSFSTDFAFSISPGDGDGLALIVVPADFLPKFSRESFGLSREKRYFAVEFDTFFDGNVGDENANHVGVDVCSLVSLKVSNVSSIDLVLNSGNKLHSWVDYDSSSKRLEVRLSKSGSTRPYDPLLVYQIDFGEMWRGEEVLVGLSSSSGNSRQMTSVYSWKFRVRTVPKWLHSQPLDPQGFSSKHNQEKLAHKNKGCVFWFLSGLIFATGCGMLVAFAVLFLSFVFANPEVAVIPVKCSRSSGDSDFRYEKINVVLEDNSTNAKS